MKNKYSGPFFRYRVLTGVLIAFVLFASEVFAVPLFINEIHYDNTGADSGEAVEIAGPAGSDLSGWSLLLYNGNGGSVYNTSLLSGIIPNQQAGFGTLFFPIAPIQNGSPDGLALVDTGSVVVQFLSYEGAFVAIGGPANGLTSTDIGVSESSSTPVGHSLQLGGIGSVYADFSWQSDSPHTFGAVNTNQRFQVASVPEPQALALMVIGLIAGVCVHFFKRRVSRV